MSLPLTKPRLNGEFGWEPVEDGCLIYSLNSSKVITLNSLSELVLTYCDGETDLPTIHARINEDAPMSPEELLRVVDQLIAETVLLVDAA